MLGEGSWRQGHDFGTSQESHYSAEPSHGGFEQHSRGRGGRGRGGRPPGLTGKEIGMYYKELHKNREKKSKKKEAENAAKVFSVRPACEQKIRALMNDTKNFNERQFNVRNQDNCYYKSDFESRYDHINDSHFKRKFLSIISGNLQDNLEKSLFSEPKLKRNDNIDDQLLDELNNVKQNNQYKNMLRFRSRLPAYEMRHEIVDLINRNQVIVISGETGNINLN